MTHPRGRWLTLLCRKACSIQSSQESPQHTWSAENPVFNRTELTEFNRSDCLGIQAKIQVIAVYAVDNSPIDIYYQLTLKKIYTTKPSHCLQQMSLNDLLVTGHHLALLKCEVSQYKNYFAERKCSKHRKCNLDVFTVIFCEAIFFRKQEQIKAASEKCIEL